MKWLDTRGFLSKPVSLAAPSPRIDGTPESGRLLKSADGLESDALGRRPRSLPFPREWTHP